MKKLFAILAVLVLFGTYAWATGEVVNDFQVTVTCPGPSLTGSDESMTPTSFVAGVTTADLGYGEWTLTGQNSVSYNLYYKKTDFADAAKITYTDTWTGFWTSAPTGNDGQTANSVTVNSVSGSTDQCGQSVSTRVTITNAKAAANAVAGTYYLTYTVSLSAF
jgi:hypothetical protein